MTDTWHRSTLPIDQRIALKAAANLAREFDGTFGAATIERSAVRPIRDEIERRVRALVDELAAVTPGSS